MRNLLRAGLDTGWNHKAANTTMGSTATSGWADCVSIHAAAAILYTPLKAICATIVVLCATFSAYAQDGHARWHQYYQHWKQPGTTVSCCNARVNLMGVETGDCEPTRYEMRNGEWYAWLRQEARWLHIPDDRLIRERNPSGEEGHLCYNTYTKQILCAVPPDTGG